MASTCTRSTRPPTPRTSSARWSPKVRSEPTDRERWCLSRPARSSSPARRKREEVRRRIAFYGSTRTYHDVLEHHDWKSVGEELHELSKEQAWDQMTDLVSDEMVATFALEADPAELRAEALDVYGDVADRIALPLEHGEAFME